MAHDGVNAVLGRGKRSTGVAGKGMAMDAVTAEDVVFLVLTFLIAAGLAMALLIWGRTTWHRQPE
jgi:hypothetical protein